MIDLWLPPKPAIIRPAPEITRASFLPGMFPAGAIAAAVAIPATVALQSSSTSTGSSVTCPSDVIAGDLLVYADSAGTGLSAPAAVTPSGFTNIVNSTGGALPVIRQMVSLKIANGSEASAAIVGMDGANLDSKILAVFRRTPAAMGFNAKSINPQLTSADPSPQVVTASGGLTPLIVFGFYTSGSATVDPRTMSPAKDGEITSNTRAYLAYKIYSSAPVDVTVDMDDEGNNDCLQSFYVEVT